jgi:uncharacterized coiled-coil DUF342 family protein
MAPTDPAVDILKEIRDEARTTNERLGGLRGEVQGLRTETSERFESLGAEVRGTNERLGGLRGEVQGLRTETNERFEALGAEVRGTNERVEGLGDEVQGLRTDVNDRFAETNDRIGRLERRQTESDLRLSTELVAVAGAVREVRDLLRGRPPAAGSDR